MATEHTPNGTSDDMSGQRSTRSKTCRFVLITTVLGGVLAGLAVPTLVMLDISGLSLRTGIRLLDSMLYSFGGGPAPIVILSVLWGLCGAFAGCLLACVYAGYSEIIRLLRQWDRD